MPETTAQPQAAERLHALTDALEAGTLQAVRAMLHELNPAEIAGLLESLPQDERKVVWGLVDPDLEGEVLAHVNDQVRASLIEEMDDQALVAAARRLETDDLADIIHDLPNAVIEQVLRSMDKQDRRRLEAVLSYPEDSAGGLMNTDTLTVRPHVTLDVVLRYLRMRGKVPELTDALFVVTRDDRYVGALPLTTILTQDPDLTVAEVMDRELEPIPADMPAPSVAKRFEDRDLVSAPVVDAEGRLLGRITIDDVVDVIREESEHSLMSLTGLSEEEDTFAPVLPAARRRAVWLGVNLATAFLASWVVGLFQDTLEKVVALAVLMPIVASMGGIAGSQTLTLVVRSIALGQLGTANVRWLIAKELAVALLNGLLWAVVVGTVAVAWFQDLRLGVVIGAAMVLNLEVAALAGVLIPIIEKRLGVDPALAGSVVLTTCTDVMGFLSFLGLATLFLR